METHNLHPTVPHTLSLNTWVPWHRDIKICIVNGQQGSSVQRLPQGRERMIFLSSWLVEGVMGSSQSCRLPVLDPVALSHFGRVRNFISPVCRCYTHIPSPATSVHVAQPLHGGGAALSRRCGGEEPCWELHLVGQCCPWRMLLWDKSLFMLVLFLVMLALSCFLGRGPNGDHGQLVMSRVTKLCFGGRSPQALR